MYKGGRYEFAIIVIIRLPQKQWSNPEEYE